MKTLSSEKEIGLTLKDPGLELSEENRYRFQELYDYLDQFRQKEDQILISIILPAYNEESTIKQILESLPNGKSIEIIVIDDNSTDNSVQEIQKVNGNRKITLLKHKKNKGYGGAVTTGINQAKGEVIVTMDSDGQHCPEDIISLIKPIFNGEADYTIGSRYLGSNHYDLPIITRLGEAIIEKLLKLFFGQKIMNNQNGFRAFNKKLISTLNCAKYNGFAYATEAIILALIDKNKVVECPVKVYDREYGYSKIGMFNLILDLSSCFLRYYFEKIVRIFTRNRK